MPELWLLQPELSWIRNLLVDHIVWGRYDFSREPKHFRDADRDLYIDELTRPLKPEDDLRFVFEDQHGSVYIFAERLTWDSEFFRYQVARLNAIFPSALLPYTSTVDFTGALAALVAEAAKRGIRYLLTSVFPEDLALVQGLSRTGFALIETRMLYHMPLANYSYSHRYPVRFAQSQDIDILKQTAREAINAYDRFHADSFIVPSEADRLVEEWVTASIERGFANVTLIPNIEHPQASTTVCYNRER